MIHIDLLGPFAPSELEDLADEDGMVPEAGDQWWAFHWPDEMQARLDSDPTWAAQWWAGAVEEAVRLTQETLEAMPDGYGY